MMAISMVPLLYQFDCLAPLPRHHHFLFLVVLLLPLQVFFKCLSSCFVTRHHVHRLGYGPVPLLACSYVRDLLVAVLPWHLARYCSSMSRHDFERGSSCRFFRSGAGRREDDT